MADVGTGTTIVFGTSSFTAEILNVGQDGIDRIAVQTSHMTTTNSHTFMPGDLVDEGEVTLEFAFNPNNQPPIRGAAETVTITFPIPAGGSAGATAQFTGFIKGWDWGAALEEKMTGTATLKVSGTVTWVDAS